MSDSYTDVILLPATWTDLYTSTGITTGMAINIWNKGNDAADIALKATAPTSRIGVPIWPGNSNNYVHVSSGENGCWAYSVKGTRLSVQTA